MERGAEPKRLGYQVLKGGVRLYADDLGELRVWTPGHTVMATQFSGRLSLGLAAAIASYSDDQARRAPSGTLFSGFHDWYEMANYDGDARKYLTAWTLGARARISELHFLVASSFVRMGLSVGNLALAMSILSYGERGPFEAAMKRVVGKG